MNKYKVSYYTSGGYKTTGILKTNLIIKKDDNNQLCIVDNEIVIGGLDQIENMFLDQLGWVENIMLFDVVKVDP